MVMDKLTQFFGTLPELCNVLARYHRASTRTDDAGSSVYAYVSGSAIAPCTIGHYGVRLAAEQESALVTRITIQSIQNTPARCQDRAGDAVGPGQFLWGV